jgi:hypothetical protein
VNCSHLVGNLGSDERAQLHGHLPGRVDAQHGCGKREAPAVPGRLQGHQRLWLRRTGPASSEGTRREGQGPPRLQAAFVSTLRVGADPGGACESRGGGRVRSARATWCRKCQKRRVLKALGRVCAGRASRRSALSATQGYPLHEDALQTLRKQLVGADQVELEAFKGAPRSKKCMCGGWVRHNESSRGRFERVLVLYRGGPNDSNIEHNTGAVSSQSHLSDGSIACTNALSRRPGLGGYTAMRAAVLSVDFKRISTTRNDDKRSNNISKSYGAGRTTRGQYGTWTDAAGRAGG